MILRFCPWPSTLNAPLFMSFWRCLSVMPSKPSLRAESLRRGFQFVTRPEGYTTTLSFIPSLGACTKSCFVPR